MAENETNVNAEGLEAGKGVQIVDTRNENEQGVHEGHADPNETPAAVTAGDGVGDADATNHGHDGSGSDEGEPETFDRPYVEKLRKESAKYRERAKRADELAQRLHTALVAADGRLADPQDLEFNETHLDDEDALAAAIGDLVTRKPGLRAQKFTGDAGAGQRGSKPKPPADLISLIRGL